MTPHIIALGQTFSGSEFWQMRRAMFPYIVIVDVGSWDPVSISTTLTEMGLQHTGYAVSYDEAEGTRYVCDGDFIMVGTVVWFKDEDAATAAALLFR